MERWSYKPEVEGLSPSLGTKFEFQVSGFKFQVSSRVSSLDRIRS